MSDDDSVRDILGDNGEPIPPSERPAKRKKTLPEALRKAMWPKGYCPNPGGRPKGRSVTARLREVVNTDIGGGVTLTDMLVKRLLEIALHPKHPDRQALVDVINRLDGKPTQTLNIQSGPIVRVYDPSCDPARALEDRREEDRPPLEPA